MLQLTICGGEMFNQITQEFITTRTQTVQLEHSLVSLSKWESKWEKPFLTTDFSKVPQEEFIDYIRCMTITQNVDPNIYYMLTRNNQKDIMDYINRKMTATVFKNNPQEKKSNEVMTAELIYYYMFDFGIPIECQKWHLNRLLTLIKVCGIKSQPPKKYSKYDSAMYNKNLNAARRAKHHSRG